MLECDHMVEKTKRSVKQWIVSFLALDALAAVWLLGSCFSSLDECWEGYSFLPLVAAFCAWPLPADAPRAHPEPVHAVGGVPETA